MADIVISFTTTAKQDAKLAKVLLAVNADRERLGQAPFATIEAYLKWVLVEAVKTYVTKQEEVDAGDVGEAYTVATDAVQAQVRALLGL